jgi:hypothetical protein
MFLEGRYLNHPYYDPLWAELERLGITAAMHSTPGLWNPEWTKLDRDIRCGKPRWWARSPTVIDGTRPRKWFAPDSSLEGDGFEPSVPR